MNRNSVSFYKYDFSTFPRDLEVSKNSYNIANSTVISEFEQIVQSQNDSVNIAKKLIAPQGVGELKQSYLPKENNLEELVPVRKVNGITEAVILTNDKMFENSSDFFFKPPTAIRNRIEDEIRKRKLSNLACPFADNNFRCSALSIRCGDRAQFAYPENREQKNLPHNCLYRVSRQAEHILIVDADENVRDFCKASLELFFRINRDKIEVASTGSMALEILKQFKLQEKRCGLLVCSQNLPDMAGHRIINEVYNRNYNTDVLLTWDEAYNNLSDSDSNILSKMVTNGDIIKAVILKPFHSATFIEAVKKINENRVQKKSV